MGLPSSMLHSGLWNGAPPAFLSRPPYLLLGATTLHFRKSGTVAPSPSPSPLAPSPSPSPSRVALAPVDVALAVADVATPPHSHSLVEEVVSAVGQEPKNALSLPTWIIHVASVVEWITAMSLVWQYGDTPGKSAWKGLSWGMLPLLGGAVCACTWHFFYNSESLEALVILQASLTVIGNFTMWMAAFRIYKAAQNGSKA